MSVVTKPVSISTEPTLADWLAGIGGVDPCRVLARPYPGSATEADLLGHCTHGEQLYELVDGALVEKPMGSPEAFLAAELIFFLRTYLRQNDLGYLYGPDGLIRLGQGLVRSPDVSFFRWGESRKVPHDPIAMETPALVVEVLSPSNTPAEMERKRRDYISAGVELVWVIDPSSLECRAYQSDRLAGVVDKDGVLRGEPVLLGFELPLAKLFEKLQ